MKLIASWTRMYELGWVHHWIVEATCVEEARAWVEGISPSGQSGNKAMRIHHFPAKPRGWRRKGYEITQNGHINEETYPV